MPLSTAQYTALRRLHDDGPGEMHTATARVLDRYGLLWTHPFGFQLSPRGEQFVNDYVAQTGDGPEDLKARLRF